MFKNNWWVWIFFKKNLESKNHGFCVFEKKNQNLKNGCLWLFSGTSKEEKTGRFHERTCKEPAVTKAIFWKFHKCWEPRFYTPALFCRDLISREMKAIRGCWDFPWSVSLSFWLTDWLTKQHAPKAQGVQMHAYRDSGVGGGAVSPHVSRRRSALEAFLLRRVQTAKLSQALSSSALLGLASLAVIWERERERTQFTLMILIPPPPTQTKIRTRKKF